ncbi:MAG: lipase family protein [Bacteroidetes bacterium]|nr:lipase family protein [Bacteroidota bacterium]
MSEMAFLAYEDKKVVEMLLKNLGFEGKFFNSIFWDGEAFIAYDDEKIILSYRGTEPTNLRDWVTDLRLNKIKTSGDNTVHTGFKEHFDELEKDFRIGSVLSILLNGNRKVFITGHSLGGALAVYAAYYYMHHMPVIKPEELRLYTYGAPRVGDHQFSQLFCAVPAYRIVHKNDIVPRVPPFEKYLPVRELYYIDETGNVVEKELLPDMVHLEMIDGQAFDWKQLLSVNPANWKQYASLIMDHSPLYYSIRLKEAAILETADLELEPSGI